MQAISGTDQQRRLLINILEGLLASDIGIVTEVLLPRLTWHHLVAGDLLFRQGESGEDLYLVVSGRLRATASGPDGGTRVVGEIMRGQSVGEMALLTGEARSASVVAMRDSVLVRLSRAAYEDIVREHPHFAINLTRLMIDRLKSAIDPQTRLTRPINICLLAITDGVDAVDMAYALARKLSYGNRVLVVAREANREDGSQADGLSSDQYQQLTRWIDEVESSHEFLIFVGERQANEWTRRCVRAADEVVLLARADEPKALHPVEECLRAPDDPLSARRTLALLHDEGQRMPDGTRAWLEVHPVDTHLHIRPTLDRDIERMARMLGGTRIGLVFSGGGARGFAHLGVMKALEAFGAQIDCIGGASIGAVMGAYGAFDLNASTMIDQAREAFRRGPTADYNLLPLTSLIAGRRLKRTIDEAVIAATGADIDIEDTWKNFFCVVSNYTRAMEMTIGRGNLATWLRTGVSIPGVLPLVPHHGELMGDGGTFNNFPTDIMVAEGADYVIGSDLLQQGFAVLEKDEIPGTGRLLVDRLRRRDRRRFHFPGLMSTLVNSMMLVSTSRQREARRRTDLCFTPQLNDIGMLDWGQFDAIVEQGYRHACEVLEKLPADQAARLRGAGVPARGVVLRDS